MDALLALIAELWWVAPTAAAAGGGVVVVRGRRRGRMRRLELDAARGDVRTAREAVARSRADAQIARAELTRAEGARFASSGTATVAAARRVLTDAQHAVRVTTTELVARRAEVRAARTALPGRHASPAALPLARLTAQHDAVVSAWMAYETDPALAIAFPAMVDARSPHTAAFLETLDQARWLRPSATPGRRAPRFSVADYAAYRDAVRRMQRAFATAEHEARRADGDTRVPPSASGWTGVAWQGVAHEVVDGVARVIAWSETVIGKPAASSTRAPHRDRRTSG